MCGFQDTERPYCSKICCTHSLESALALKEINPEMHVYILYRDIRSYGFREDLYREAREKGIIFIRYDLEHYPGLKQLTGRNSLWKSLIMFWDVPSTYQTGSRDSCVSDCTK